jgi:phosphoribosylaminoimidazole-succinocarboxamide synthase
VPIKIEVVVRGYLAGSMLRAYEKGERIFCGTSLPEGLTPYCKLPKPIITPTTKAAAFEHDENTSPAQLVNAGVCSHPEWEEVAGLAFKVFDLGSKIYAERGWILVDTKYEFGKSRDGKIKLIDEVHTPDSSRLWVQESYQERMSSGLSPQMLDKENVRRWLVERGFTGYGDVPEVPREVLLNLVKVYLDVAETLTKSAIMI